MGYLDHERGMYHNEVCRVTMGRWGAGLQPSLRLE